MSTSGWCWEVKRTKTGEGLFARIDIGRGETILKIWGHTLTFEDTLLFTEKESYCLQIDSKKYIALHFPFFLCNHSCEPNCGINANLEFITLREIKAGEELLWDYSTSMMERYWTMRCTCGSAQCRKIVDDFDTLPKETQQKYIEDGIVMPYILDLI